MNNQMSLFSDSDLPDIDRSGNYTVGKVVIETDRRVIHARSVQTGQTTMFVAHRMAQIFEQDELQVDADDNISVVVDSGLCQIVPSFELTQTILLGATEIEVICKEVIDAADEDALEYLEQFHYLTNLRLKYAESESLRPMKNHASMSNAVSLIMYLALQNQRIPVGFISLSNSLLSMGSRFRSFQKLSFKHPKRKDVRWDYFSKDLSNALTNHIFVRIPRVTIAPEYRAVGLTKFLLHAGERFIRTRWHFRKSVPLFVEIQAAMLKYVPFVLGSGFYFCGASVISSKELVGQIKKQFSQDAFGNVDVSDIFSETRTKNLNKVSMALESRYKRFVEWVSEYQIPADKAIQQLETALRKYERNERMTEQESMLRSLFMTEKHYYLKGLDESAQKYAEAVSEPISFESFENVLKTDLNIEIEKMTVSMRYQIPYSEKNETIKNIFGLTINTIHNDIIKDVSLTAKNGEIVLIAGASGSGKSILLESIDRNHALADNLVMRVQKHVNGIERIGRFSDIDSERTIYDILCSITEDESVVFSILGRVGLSEAMTLIKPIALLSQGQQYRARIALLIAENYDLWLIDEFCADLDTITAKTCAQNIRRYISRTRRICIAAAANNNHFVDALKPDRVLVLNSGALSQMMSFEDYMKTMI